MRSLVLVCTLFFVLAALGTTPPTTTEETDFLIPQKEWLNSFNDNYASLFCEKLRAAKTCKKLTSADCIAYSKKSLAECTKKIDFPEKISPGLPSNEIALRLGACAGRSTELALIDSEVCTK